MENAPDKSFKNLKVKPALHHEIDVAAAQLGQPMYQFVQDMWETFTAAHTHSAPHANGALAFPSPFEGLSDYQIFTVHTLIEIFRHQPQGAIFRALDRTIEQAVSEYRKLHPTKEGIPSPRPIELPSSTPEPTPSALEQIAIGRLLRILRSPKPGLPDAILSNLTQFEDTDILYDQQRRSDPAAGSAPGDAERPAGRNRRLASLSRDTSAAGSRITAVSGRLAELERARAERDPGKKKHPGKTGSRS